MTENARCGVNSPFKLHFNFKFTAMVGRQRVTAPPTREMNHFSDFPMWLAISNATSNSKTVAGPETKEVLLPCHSPSENRNKLIARLRHVWKSLNTSKTFETTAGLGRAIFLLREAFTYSEPIESLRP
jgi:hypothetical protein